MAAVGSVFPANGRVTDGARTRDLRDHNPNGYVLTCPSLLGNSAYLNRKSGFDSSVFSVPFVSVLSLLLPHCCHSCFV